MVNTTQSCIARRDGSGRYDPGRVKLNFAVLFAINIKFSNFAGDKVHPYHDIVKKKRYVFFL